MKNLLIVLTVFFNSFVGAQTFTTDFSWINPLAYTSNTTVQACGEPVIISVNTSPRHYIYGGNALFIPENYGNSSITQTSFTITFSQPVTNLRLRVDDLDDRPSLPGIEEFLNGFVDENSQPVVPTSIDPVLGAPTMIIAGNQVTPPTGIEDAISWLVWDGTHSEISFTYNRPGAHWGLRIDSLEFDCPTCNCEGLSADLKEYDPVIPSHGLETASVVLNSNGNAISKAIISVSNYEILTNPQCLNLSNFQMNRYGKIQNLPSINGVSPEFSGSIIYNSSSFELIYNFPNPVILNNELIQLELMFPSSSCKQFVEYCIRTTFFDRECFACDYLTCTSKDGSTIPQDEPQTLIVHTPLIDGNYTKTDMIIESGGNIWPNPTAAHFEIIVKGEFSEQGNLKVFDQLGRVHLDIPLIFNTIQKVNTDDLPSGSYIVHCLAPDNSIIKIHSLIIEK